MTDCKHRDAGFRIYTSRRDPPPRAHEAGIQSFVSPRYRATRILWHFDHMLCVWRNPDLYLGGWRDWHHALNELARDSGLPAFATPNEIARGHDNAFAGRGVTMTRS